MLHSKSCISMQDFLFYSLISASRLHINCEYEYDANILTTIQKRPAFTSFLHSFCLIRAVSYHQQAWCRRGKLQYLVNDYVTDTGYSEEEFGILVEILNEMESNVRKYALPLDLVSIRDQFIALYAVATEETQKEAAVTNAPAAKRAERKAKADKERKAKTWWMVAACAGGFPLAAAACAVALKKTRVAS